MHGVEVPESKHEEVKLPETWESPLARLTT